MVAGSAIVDFILDSSTARASSLAMNVAYHAMIHCQPASSLASRTRIKTLTRETIEANRPHFDDPAKQPQLAITMGIASIMDAREILLLATGESKADAVRELVEGPVSARCPASMLQMHERVTVVLDTKAAARLELRDYYDWVAAQKRAVLDRFGGSS